MSQRGPSRQTQGGHARFIELHSGQAPVRTFDTFDELAKAKAKLAEHGHFLSLLKRKSDTPGSGSKRAKPELPIVAPEAQNDAQ